MTYSIIGSGNVGTALARQFAGNGIRVSIANTRGPESMAALAKELGANVVPATLQDALKADVVILAFLFRGRSDVGRALSDWSGKIVVDAMNTYGVPPEELKGQESTDLVAASFPGAKVVKTLNQMPAKLLGEIPAADGGRRVMFLSSNDAGAEKEIAELVANLGFAPIMLGKVNEGGRLIDKSGPLILQNLIKLG